MSWKVAPQALRLFPSRNWEERGRFDWLDKGNLPEKLFQVVKDAPKYDETEESKPSLSKIILETVRSSVEHTSKGSIPHPWLTEQSIFS